MILGVVKELHLRKHCLPLHLHYLHKSKFIHLLTLVLTGSIWIRGHQEQVIRNKKKGKVKIRLESLKIKVGEGGITKPPHK